MATFLDGNVRRATANTVTAMKRSAERRRCAECNRKSAMVRTDEGRFCRWCGAGTLWAALLDTTQSANITAHQPDTLVPDPDAAE